MQDWPKLISKLPKNLTFTQAANMLLLPYSATRKALLQHGYKFLDGRSLRWAFRTPPSCVKWGRVDWSQSNVMLAEKYQISREYVRQMRDRFNQPKVEARGAKRKETKCQRKQQNNNGSWRCARIALRNQKANARRKKLPRSLATSRRQGTKSQWAGAFSTTEDL